MPDPGKPEGHATSTAEEIGAMAEKTITPMFRSYGVWLDSLSKVQLEAWRFMLDRIRKDLETSKQLTECESPTQAFEAQAKFASTMVSDYVSESEKLLSLSLQGLRDSAGEASRTEMAIPPAPSAKVRQSDHRQAA